MDRLKRGSLFTAAMLTASLTLAQQASAGLMPSALFTGKVGLSVDGVGSNNSPVGFLQADIPVGATIEKAFLYSAGTPFPWYADSPTTLGAYNGAGISLAGSPITNFDTLVGATSIPRPDIGQWFTGRADVTSLIQSLTAGAVTNNFSWEVSEGSLNNRVDGEVLAVVYSHPSLPEGSVALLDGGQDTGGETTVVNLSEPLGDPTALGFEAELGLGISFSIANQRSRVEVNGSLLTENAGDNDDGAIGADGSLITVGGLGDDPSNNVGSYADDDELYDLRPFLNQGDTGFTIFTNNATGDDNIFFASLYLTGKISNVNPGVVPEPSGLAAWSLLCVFGTTAFPRKRRRA